MATAVGVMDAPGLAANTDVLVLVDSEARLILWIPRDLWCESIRDRVNQAFALGGHEGLALALRDHGLELDASICFDRLAAERVLDRLEVEVPVSEPMEFYYPSERDRPIEEGRIRIRFDPPSELLKGERVHQWLGARFGMHGPGTDLRRIARQQTLVGLLLARGTDLSGALEVPDQVSISGPALEEISRVDGSFTLGTFAESAVPRTIDGKQVLVR